MNTKAELMGAPFAPILPHVVVLGAGASRASFSNGDGSGKLLPVMDELPLILGEVWSDLVKQLRPPVEGFEAQFSWMRSRGEVNGQLLVVEELIIEYFEDLCLPDVPTIYDYLLLGLRSKDVVATFNWDPLLFLAHKRNRGAVDLPDIRFLHGCVGHATCQQHDVLGSLGEVCPECFIPLSKGQLFFPDEEKDYTKDQIVDRDWGIVAQKLRKAFHLTIFGYSGPSSDLNARRLLLEGWKDTPMRDFSHVEVIDIRDNGDLIKCWREFIPFDHDMIIGDFFESTIAKWPRRTAEYKISASLYGVVSEPVGPYLTNSLSELQDWHAKIAAAENQ